MYRFARGSPIGEGYPGGFARAPQLGSRPRPDLGQTVTRAARSAMRSRRTRFIVRVVGESTNQFGEHVETTTNYPAWARLIQDTVARTVEAGGVYGLAARTWRVRFNQAFVDAQEAGQTITVVYGTEEPDRVTGVGEPTTAGPLRRRRFLDLQT